MLLCQSNKGTRFANKRNEIQIKVSQSLQGLIAVRLQKQLSVRTSTLKSLESS